MGKKRKNTFAAVKKNETIKPFRRKGALNTPKVDPKLLMKYSKGSGVDNFKVFKDPVEKAKLIEKERRIGWTEEHTARTEVLLTEDAGYIIPDEREKLKHITQKKIAKAVDITSATKYFDLDLKFGPYRFDYTRNGRHLLIGGKKGHVAALDWVTKRLHCEINVMEEVADVQWLHIETMFAVAQKNWVYMYDNQGVELHCIKSLYRVLRMCFLPYHFLLATSNEDGFLSWLDVSIGTLVANFNTKKGRLQVMTQNPYNAVLCLGHSNGVVTMWGPNNNKPLASMLCHQSGVQAIAVDQTGKYMATSSANSEMRIWDIRQLEGPLRTYKLNHPPCDLSFSQRGCLAVAINNVVQVYKDCHKDEVTTPYLMHRTRRFLQEVNFCPYEDVLGLSTGGGFTSILVPGCGEPNFDALEANPFQSKSQRREAEVKSLLDKIQPELITLDPTTLGEVDLPTLYDKVEARKKLLFIKPPQIDFTPRKKKRGNTVRAARIKKIVQENSKKNFVKDLKEVRKELMNEMTEDDKAEVIPEKTSVLDRFKKKRKK